MVPEIHYRVHAPALGHFPGHHRSRRGTSGFEFRGHASLLDSPDTRRLDLHASLRDPFGQWRVRVYDERRSIPVVLVADLSASMAFDGARRKLDVLADFAESLAWSAWRTGDAFGFVGCDDAPRADFLQPPTRVRGAGSDLGQRLRAFVPDARTGRTARGLLEAHRSLGRRRALVFLASDFHLSRQLLAPLLDSLAGHDVVPVVLWDAQEFGFGARAGLVQVFDPETGRRRLVWWRAALRERWLARQAQRRAALLAFFRARRLSPLFVEGAFDAEAVTRHFHS